MNKVKKIFIALLVGLFLLTMAVEVVLATSQSNDLQISGGAGKITSNVWRSTFKTSSGNTYQWDYEVSAVYTGSRTVTRIKTEWTISASLKESASMTIGVSDKGVSAGASASWKSVSESGSWTNNNGAKSASKRSNIVIAPKAHYKSNTISVINTASVTIQGDARTFSINAGV